MPHADPPLLEAESLVKSFSGVPVLKQVSFTVRRGEALGLVGENGAGKSTLMNLMGGVLQPDAGVMRCNGQPYAPRGPLEAKARGIAFVHQELNLFDNLSIADNLFLTGFPRRRVLGVPLIHHRAMRERAQALLSRVNLAVGPDTPVERLSQGERQLVEIAKALDGDARLILFDEPTTSLTSRECDRLFSLIDRLRAEGIAVIYISHALDDVLRLCQRIAVLRDGEMVGEAAVAELPKHRLIELMVGRRLDQLYPERTQAPQPDIILSVQGVSQPGTVDNISFSVRRGEVVGIAGLMGSGRSELARILFGLDPMATGEVVLNGERIDPLPTRNRIRRGMAFLTESRRDDGLLLDAPIDENLLLVHPLPDRIPEVVRRLQVACANVNRQPVRQLSGGNQQKVALGKWLLLPPSLLILDEPTRGIDVGARHEIYQLINDLSAQGVGLLVISSEIEELTGLCDRILVLSRGELRGTFDRPQFHRETILAAAL